MRDSHRGVGGGKGRTVSVLSCLKHVLFSLHSVKIVGLLFMFIHYSFILILNIQPSNFESLSVVCLPVCVTKCKSNLSLHTIPSLLRSIRKTYTHTSKLCDYYSPLEPVKLAIFSPASNYLNTVIIHLYRGVKLVSFVSSVPVYWVQPAVERG